MIPVESLAQIKENKQQRLLAVQNRIRDDVDRILEKSRTDEHWVHNAGR